MVEMRCIQRLFFCGMVSIVLAGCLPIDLGSHDVPVTTVPVVSVKPPLFRAGDRIRITVFGEDKLTGDYDVDEAGSISLPLIGPVHAAGLSEQDLDDALTDKLRQAFLKDPRVTVATLSKRPFYILGEVEKPGEYPYRSGLDIWRAMALAGGQTYRASTSTVAIQRAGESDFHDYKLASDVSVGPGDVVRVPERWF